MVHMRLSHHLSTFNDKLRFCVAVFLLFPALDAARVFAAVRFLRIFHRQPAIADNVFVDFVVGMVLEDFLVVLFAHNAPVDRVQAAA